MGSVVAEHFSRKTPNFKILSELFRDTLSDSSQPFWWCTEGGHVPRENAVTKGHFSFVFSKQQSHAWNILIVCSTVARLRLSLFQNVQKHLPSRFVPKLLEQLTKPINILVLTLMKGIAFQIPIQDDWTSQATNSLCSGTAPVFGVACVRRRNWFPNFRPTRAKSTSTSVPWGLGQLRLADDVAHYSLLIHSFLSTLKGQALIPCTNGGNSSPTFTRTSWAVKEFENHINIGAEGKQAETKAIWPKRRNWNFTQDCSLSRQLRASLSATGYTLVDGSFSVCVI